MSAYGWFELVSRVGVVKGEPGSLLAAPVAPRFPVALLRVSFAGTATSTLALTGFGTGAAALFDGGAAIPAGTLWTGTVAVRGTGHASAMTLDVLVSAPGTYTLLIEEQPA